MRIIAGSFSSRRLKILRRQYPFDIFMSIPSSSISCARNTVCLTTSEFRIVFALAVNTGIVTKNSLIDILYGDDETGGAEFASKCVRGFVHRARHKLFNIPLTITTWHGVGYELKLNSSQYLLEAA